MYVTTWTSILVGLGLSLSRFPCSFVSTVFQRALWDLWMSTWSWVTWSLQTRWRRTLKVRPQKALRIYTAVQAITNHGRRKNTRCTRGDGLWSSSCVSSIYLMAWWEEDRRKAKIQSSCPWKSKDKHTTPGTAEASLTCSFSRRLGGQGLKFTATVSVMFQFPSLSWVCVNTLLLP